MTKIPKEIWARDFEAPQYKGTFFKYEPDDERAVKYIRADLVPQWQPIETAPRDGRYLLLYIQGDVEIGAWTEDPYSKEQGWFINDGDEFSTSSYYTQTNPTHWMPLPEPPKKEK